MRYSASRRSRPENSGGLSVSIDRWLHTKRLAYLTKVHKLLLFVLNIFTLYNVHEVLLRVLQGLSIPLGTTFFVDAKVDPFYTAIFTTNLNDTELVLHEEVKIKRVHPHALMYASDVP